MIQPAGKYTSVRDAAKVAPGPKSSPSPRPGAASAKPGGVKTKVPILQPPEWKNLDRLADTVANIQQKEARQRSGVDLFVPRYTMLKYGDWVWKGLRDGGWMTRYLDAKRHTAKDRLRAVAKARHGFKQNFRSDMRLLASIPAYEYFAARKYVDKHFWEDNNNLRAWRRDNPDATVYL